METETIAIVSAGRHTGATHLTLCLANILCSVRGERVAVLEWNTHQDFQKLEQICTRQMGITKPFRVLGVDYYKAAGSREWEFCMQKTYRYILVDYGEADEQILFESRRCGTRIMLGALSEWQQDAFLAQIEAEQKWKRGFIFAVTFGSRQTKAEAEKKLHVKLHQVPLSVDAFSVGWDDIRQLMKLL